MKVHSPPILSSLINDFFTEIKMSRREALRDLVDAYEHCIGQITPNYENNLKNIRFRVRTYIGNEFRDIVDDLDEPNLFIRYSDSQYLNNININFNDIETDDDVEAYKDQLLALFVLIYTEE